MCENIDTKRELLYSFSTLVFTPILYYFAVTSAFKLSEQGVLSNDPSTASVLSSTGEGVQDGGPLPATPVISDHEEEKVGGGGDESVTNNGTGGSSVGRDPIIGFILEQRELPFETVFYVVVFEVLKLLIVFTVFPGSHLFDQTPSLQTMWNLSGMGNVAGGGSGLIGTGGSSSSGKASQGRLPFSKRDNLVAKSQPLQIKVKNLNNENFFCGPSQTVRFLKF